MAIKDVYFRNLVTDVHITRRNGWNAVPRELTWIIDTVPAQTTYVDDYLSHHPGSCTVTFEPLFVKPGFLADVLTIDPATGEIAFVNPSDTIAPFNFILMMKCVVPGRPEPIKKYIRIHVHNRLTRAWLTPHTLHIPVGQEHYKFSVYGQFDDDLVAHLDIDFRNKFLGSWTNADVNSGEIQLTPGNLDPITVSVEVHDGNPGDPGTDSYTVSGTAQPYEPQTRVRPLWGLGYDWKDRIPNVLFISEGFVNDETLALMRSNLEQQIMEISRGSFSPYDELIKNFRINFWLLEMESHEPGIPFKGEVYIANEDSKDVARLVRMTFSLNESLAAATPGNPPPDMNAFLGTNGWTVGKLNFVFGLPYPRHTLDDNVENDIKQEWIERASIPQSWIQGNNLPISLVTEWRKTGDRTFLSDRSTFGGFATGKATSAILGPDSHRDDYYRMDGRMSRLGLNAILDDLELEPDKRFGRIWHMKDPDDPIDFPGKDAKFVGFMLNGPHGRAGNYGNDFTLTATPVNWPLEVAPDPARPTAQYRMFRYLDSNVTLNATQMQAERWVNDMRRTLIHELSHSFWLGDEYGEEGNPPFNGSEGAPNLVAEDSLLTNNQIDGSKIKWRWHRISAARMLSGAVTSNGGSFTIPITEWANTTNVPNTFAQNDIVLLRKRDPASPLARTTHVSVKLKISAPVNDGDTSIMVQLNDASPVLFNPFTAVSELESTITNFGAGDMLYKPVPAPAAAQAMGHTFAELIGANILQYISQNHRPTSAVPCASTDDIQYPELDGVTLPDRFSESSCCGNRNSNRTRITGLYSGGSFYHCGIYHSSGYCIMRDNHSVAEFCAVCRYILVDTIAPELHPFVDQFIAANYTI